MEQRHIAKGFKVANNLVMLLLTLQVIVAMASGDASSHHLLPHKRPAKVNRTFSSEVVDAYINATLKKPWRNQNLSVLFSNCLPNALDQAVKLFRPGTETEKPDAFIITGDIPAMWLRDSMNALLPYFRFVSADMPDSHLGALLRGALYRSMSSVMLDSYANAFALVGPKQQPSPHTQDHTSGMVMGVYERKYEVDSLASVLKLGREYYKATKDPIPFQDGDWVRTVRRIIDTYRGEQKEITAINAGKAPYQFQRNTNEPTDTLSHSVGWPGRYTGMIRTAFRPSDDGAKYPYNIPVNAFAAVELESAAAMLRDLGLDAKLAEEASVLANEIKEGIRHYGVVEHPTLRKKVYAYEVDGFGNAYFSDDANIPSLLSLPYLGFVKKEDRVYLNTREMVLNERTNPWYFRGTAPAGIGGVHNGLGYVWPLSLIMQAMTSDSDEEISKLLEDLVQSSAGTGLMHESYWLNNVSTFTRPWFVWANALLGELLIRLSLEKPTLIFKNSEKKSFDDFLASEVIPATRVEATEQALFL